jgi:hypothetical protein
VRERRRCLQTHRNVEEEEAFEGSTAVGSAAAAATPDILRMPPS